MRLLLLVLYVLLLLTAVDVSVIFVMSFYHINDIQALDKGMRIALGGGVVSMAIAAVVAYPAFIKYAEWGLHQLSRLRKT